MCFDAVAAALSGPKGGRRRFFRQVVGRRQLRLGEARHRVPITAHGLFTKMRLIVSFYWSEIAAAARAYAVVRMRACVCVCVPNVFMMSQTRLEASRIQNILSPRMIIEGGFGGNRFVRRACFRW